MGGRGTFAAGKIVPYTYETVGKIHDIKILKGTNGKHGLPEEAHSSGAYISLHPNGNTKQLRVYNKNLTAKTDIEYSVHQGKMTFHAHDYVNGIRQPARSLTSEEKRLYGKYFGGKQ